MEIRGTLMKKIFVLGITISFAILIACGDNVKSGNFNEEWVRAANEELAKYSISGFGYKQSNLPASNWNSWFKANEAAIKRIFSEAPEGYVLQVTGHTDATGPEMAEDNKPGNIKLSNDRAKTVYDVLVKNKIDSSKLTQRGVGSSQLLEGVGPRDAKQRRVSFIIIQK